MAGKSDYELGKRVHQHLLDLDIETPLDRGVMGRYSEDEKLSVMSSCVHDVLQYTGLDLTNDSLQDTPRRVSEMYCREVFTGLDYRNFPKCTTVENGFQYDEMIAGKATVMSMCEHHLVPFIGVAYIGYIPKRKVIGLSKFNRVVDFFSRRPQVQERLTMQIAETLKFLLETDSVAVVIQAEHLCVKLRGVKDQNSHTTTSKMGGKFFTEASLRSEFLALTRSS